MHSTAVGSGVGVVPAFLVKLWKLVEDPHYDDFICWNSSGTSFFIRDQPRFSRELLPLYFKHSNMASFIRQLNMYGFRKVTSIDSGGLRVDKDEVEFQHSCFLKGNANLLECIKRKISAGKSLPQEEAKSQPDLVNKMLFDVKSLHGKQESLNSKLDNVKRENEALWREIASLRQQHLKQQQIIQKLIQFFISFVQPNRGMGVGTKRKMPLMLNASPHSEAKCNRLSRTLSYDNGSASAVESQKIASPSSSTLPPAGPVIHDITDSVDADTFMNMGSKAVLQLTNYGTAPFSPAVELAVNSPGPSGCGADDAEESRLSYAAPALLESADVVRDVSLESVMGVDIVDHIDTVNMELDALKDLFSSGDFTIDASTLMGLFSTDDILPNKSLSDMGEFGKLPGGNEIVGNELTQFTTGAFDLADSDPSAFLESDLEPDSEGLVMAHDGMYDYVNVGALDENDRRDGRAAATLSTDLTLAADLDLFAESPGTIAEDVTASPGRRKESSSKT